MHACTEESTAVVNYSAGIEVVTKHPTGIAIIIICQRRGELNLQSEIDKYNGAAQLCTSTQMRNSNQDFHTCNIQQHTFLLFRVQAVMILKVSYMWSSRIPSSDRDMLSILLIKGIASYKNYYEAYTVQMNTNIIIASYIP